MFLTKFYFFDAFYSFYLSIYFYLQPISVYLKCIICIYLSKKLAVYQPKICVLSSLKFNEIDYKRSRRFCRDILTLFRPFFVKRLN